ncbi:MAG: hypothetical protein ACHQ17_00360 [Polyangia bacterium]
MIALVAAALGLPIVACNQNVINTPIRSFDRPSDVALTCVQGDPVAQRLYDAHPLSDCTPENIIKLSFDATGAPNPDGGFNPQERALVTQSARGELTLVDINGNQLVDLRPFTPGFGFLPVGKLPTHVRVAEDGCRAATTNTDSCDLSLIDLPTLYNLPRKPLISDGGIPDGSPLGQPSFGDEVVDRIPINVDGRELLARPSWIELQPTAPKPASGPLPESYAGLHGFQPGGTPGQCLGGSYHAWVALPTCQLVVEVNLEGGLDAAGKAERPGQVVRAVRVTQSGAEVVSDLSTISCPEECPPAPAPLSPQDGGVSAPADGGVAPLQPDFDAGAAPDGGDGGVVPRLPDNQAYPGTLALDFENGVGRLFIGDLAGERITIVPIDGVSGALGAPRAVTLEKGALGVQVVRVSPRSQAGKFLYAVARDGTVRVIDLDREAECETNPDPRAVEALPVPKDKDGLPIADPLPTARRLGCFPLGDPNTPPRSPLFTSPGIVLPNGALPRDVSFVHLDILPVTDPAAPPVAAAPTTMVGDFAWVIGSDGRATVVNLFDACPEPNVPQSINNNMAGPYTPACSLGNVPASRFPSGESTAKVDPGSPLPLVNDRAAHRIRQSNDRFLLLNSADTSGAPRVDDPNNPFTVTVNGVAAAAPSTLAVDGGAAQPTPPSDLGAPVDAGVALPGLVTEINSFQRPETIAFYDPDHVRNETWSVAWQGLIPSTDRSLGRMVPGELADAGAPPTALPMLVDNGAAFCTRGVQQGDQLVLDGCTKDTDCDFAQACIRDPGAPKDVPNGMCLDRDPTLQAAEKKDCSPLLRSPRTFQISSARQGAALATGEVTDVLQIQDIDEEPDELDPVDCTTSGDACPILIGAATDAHGQPVDLPTTCEKMPDGSHRCVRMCSTDAKLAADSPERLCGGDFVCGLSVMNDQRCMLGPLDPELFEARSQGGSGCVRELQNYEVHGQAFVVSGSVSGFLSDLEPDPTTRECVVPPISSPYVRLHQPRIPVALSQLTPCPSGVDIFSSMSGVPAACLFSDGPKGREIHFENPYFAIGVVVPAAQLVPPMKTVLSFNVIGGGAPLSVPLIIDAQAQQPMAVVTAPDRATVYIVDEGKSSVATGLRGQLFRLFSASQSLDHLFVIR